jgi:hypothetical protein
MAKLEALMAVWGPEEIDVVSVHSPKFASEAGTETVEDAIRRVEVSRAQ